ncbi:NIF system FeS cluster assembly NifU N-terminal [Arabidopsis suecica]|uniref:NIF system FeS cluster assembly NifU N-terminal n=1 Tax=Arabidopsis suecica TaxID=45249 RepID=A0A8T2B485_ARASU|nr:NIF system FeS cluster assembly NifU N-terminal [Arabidopsis suecica]
MSLQIKVDDSRQIVDTRFEAFGCGSDIASIMVSNFDRFVWIKGKTLEEVLTIKNAEIAKHLRLPPVKLHCNMLAEDAIKSAVRDYKKKQSKANNAAGAAGETVKAGFH